MSVCKTRRRNAILAPAPGRGRDYRVLDETIDAAFDRGWSAIRRVLSELQPPQSAAAILRDWPADCSPPSRATLYRWLARAVERRWLCLEASERRNAPGYYWLPDAEEG